MNKDNLNNDIKEVYEFLRNILLVTILLIIIIFSAMNMFGIIYNDISHKLSYFITTLDFFGLISTSSKISSIILPIPLLLITINSF